MGSYKTFVLSVVLAKNLVEVCSRGVSSSKGFSGIFDSELINLSDQVITPVGIERLTLVSKQPLMDFRINGRLTTFVSVVHSVHFSLPCEESQLSGIFGGVSSESFVVPLQVFKLSFPWSGHQHWRFCFLAP